MRNRAEKLSTITVVIPTFNRLPTLLLCLRHLEAQTIKNFQVIIVNDGSTDGTEQALEEIQKRSPLHPQVLHQKNSGPARGRNLAIKHVTTDLCLLIGDDILAAPTLLEAHLTFHNVNPHYGAVGLGWTQWDQVHQKVTPFMQWYEEVQFDYGNLTAGLAPTWQHFYTSNLSFKTSLIQTNPFDERFKSAAWEDIELGFRLFRAGTLQLAFLQAAVATHVHPTTFLQAVKRMQTLGCSEHQFHQIWPAARSSVKPDFKAKICVFLGHHPFLLTMFTSAVDRLASCLKPGKLHAMLLRGHHQHGYLGSTD